MFGFVMANTQELTEEQKIRYGSVYCGICRRIRQRSSQKARLVLSYDMAFLALLHMSLYEPEEIAGTKACALHPVKPRPWVENIYIDYAADMNVALAYYKAKDDWQDEGSLTARTACKMLEKDLARIEEAYPRQCRAIAECIERLTELEKNNCPNPDLPANCFGQLMSQLLIYRPDFWERDLGQMGMSLGRFIYLADAAIDYRKDLRKKRYNPFIAMETGEDWQRWKEYLTLDMAKCTAAFQRLPLVQDKEILDNILYSGIWMAYGKQQKEQSHDR